MKNLRIIEEDWQCRIGAQPFDLSFRAYYYSDLDRKDSFQLTAEPK
jgi:hypothetical protein